MPKLSIEPVRRPVPGPAAILGDVSAAHASNAVVALLFAASAPAAIILGVGTAGGLSEADLGSWIFAAFAVNGLVTIALSTAYRMPLAFFWTIPGTVLVGSALDHLAFEEVIGAFLATGLLLLVLGVTGSIRRIMALVPMPLIMAMVAGVFLSFGLEWVTAVFADPLVALPMTAAFFALPILAPRFPAMLGVLVVGAGAVALSGEGPGAALFHPEAGPVAALPTLYRPLFSWQAMVELVIPLAITVIAAQNAQGIAILKARGHAAPVDAVTAACGAGSLVTGFLGSVSTCLTGPSNAILASSEDRGGHYTAAVGLGLLGIAFGLFAPVFIRVMLATPPAFIATLAGLALLKVLEGAFRIAFSGRFTFGALVTLLVTLSGITLFNVGAPFWGLVFGFLASWATERTDFRANVDEAA